MHYLVLSLLSLWLELTRANPPCLDSYSYTDCNFYRRGGYCKTHQETLSRLCRRTCKLCNYGLTTRSEFCLDEDSPENCELFKSEGLCHKYENLLRVKCAKTCKLCESQSKCKNIKCTSYQTCLLDKDGTARCQCPRYCPYKDAYRKLGQVCATDGKTYKDVCHMLHHSCREGKNLSVAFYGVCQSDKPCEDGKAEGQTGTCLSWKNLGLCEEDFYKDIMEKYCKKTCRLCPEERTPYPQLSCHSSPYGCCWDWKPRPAPGQGTCRKCTNRYPNLCRNFISLCNSPNAKNQNFMRSYCPGVCGYCGYENSKNHEIRAYRANGKTYYRLQQKLNRRSG